MGQNSSVGSRAKIPETNVIFVNADE